MLTNLLSRKSFFSQIFLTFLFIVLFFIVNYPFDLNTDTSIGLFFTALTWIISIVFFNRSNLIKQPGIALFYFLIWSCVFSDIGFDFRMSISFFASTLIFLRLLQAERRPENKKFLFDIGLLLSLSAFFYPPSLFLLFFLIFCFLYKQTINLRSFLLFVIGLTLPLLLGAQILFLLDKQEWFEAYRNSFQIQLWQNNISALIPVGILIIFAWIDHLSNLTTQNINKRHFYFLGFLYFWNWILILFFYGHDQMYSLAFLALSIAIFLTRITQYQRSKIIREVFLWVYLLAMLGFYFRNDILNIYQDLLGNVSF